MNNLWKGIDLEINLKSKEELKSILKEKTTRTMNKFYYFIGISIILSIGFIIFLIITACNRNNDIIYQLNNYFACLLTLISLIGSIWSWKKLQENKLQLPLKDWLEQRIEMLSKWLSGKLVYFMIPILAIPTILSIHVYYEYKSFIEVIKTEESIYGLLVGFIIGIIVSFFVATKIRKDQSKNLNFLNDLYKQLCSIS
ncbi:hypothetical protein ACFLSE_07155 [Bacteroidota bacterium]